MVNESTLSIQGLSVAVEGRFVLKNFSLAVNGGSIHLIMGQNGSGKSTLARTLMGDPQCQVTTGVIMYQGHDLLALTADKRAQLGIFLAFQNPCVIPGVSVFTLLREAYQVLHKNNLSVSDFRNYVLEQMALLGMDGTMLERSFNEGFSGGEKKKLELLQMLVLRPSCIILDEIDSGLDIDALKLVAQTISSMQAKNPALLVIFITHNPRVITSMDPESIHIISRGLLVYSGGVEVLSLLESRGYDAFISSI